ncbi:UpxY family transcription antiterminator [uncultured Parabacteroides sp.]|uniref:UpxY family transcription antiterminator n=1 Tax=uncultured Parabacteroides sp. TaxID=512312 RepID=UPI00260466BD|nr:UpxY family transcription antiterminator [uncultured Parabacteroides sp.]
METYASDNKGTVYVPVPEVTGDDMAQWFVMRDLSRSNAKEPAWKILEELEMDYFTPMVQKLVIRNGRREKEKAPYIQDLVFVHESRSALDPIVENVRTFQYRYLKRRVPMTVREVDMKRFVRAVESTKFPRFYRPDEITQDMLRHRIRIVGGNLDGYEGFLLTVRGSRVKRLLVELPTLLAVSVEVKPEFVQLL